MLKVIELFAGLGAYSKSLENLKIPHETVAAVEFDKKTMNCYNIIHGTTFEPMDITKLTGDELPDCDMICYSPPCQSFSVAGKGEGTNDPRGTLFWDALRIIKSKKPKYLLMENVKGLTQKKHKNTFATMLKLLEAEGYKNYWKVLNAKDYGIPQNRERVFVISIREDISQTFDFPQPFDNGLRLKDLLEETVDEKYFISENKCKKLLEELKDKQILTGVYNQNDGFRETEVACTIDASCYKGLGCNQNRNAVCIPVLTPDRLEKRQNGRRFKTDGEPAFTVNTLDRHGVLLQVGMLDIKGNEQVRRVYSTEGISPTLNTMQGGNRQPKIIIDDTMGFEEETRIYTDTCPSLRASRSGLKIITNYRIRKLTPLECIRLMSFDDMDFHKLKQAKISDTQIYKMCGNSIVCGVLEAIFKQLFKGAIV